MAARPEVPPELLDPLRSIATELPELLEEGAWVGRRWRVRRATVAHVFGGEDGLFRLVLRGRPEEVLALEHLGPPYFRAAWGSNVIGLVLGSSPDWAEIRELMIDSYCLQAPPALADRAPAPGA